LAQKSILKEVCLFYDDNRFLTYKQIAQKFNISHQTVYNYIRKGKELGIIK
jgi:transposase